MVKCEPCTRDKAMCCVCMYNRDYEVNIKEVFGDVI